MKKFTCREMGGPCDMEFEGENMQEVVSKGGQHIMTTTDEGHKPMRDQMQNGTEEGKKEWFAWFQGEWDKKKDEYFILDQGSNLRCFIIFPKTTGTCARTGEEYVSG